VHITQTVQRVDGKLLIDDKLGTPPHVVQAIARHADVDVTMRIYAHTNLDSMREAVDKIDWGAP
jgi:integrase